MPPSKDCDLMYPTPDKQERRADFIVHGMGLIFILAAGLALLLQAAAGHGLAVVAAVGTYVACVAFSHVISMFYHLSPFHDRRLDAAPDRPCGHLSHYRWNLYPDFCPRGYAVQPLPADDGLGARHSRDIVQDIRQEPGFALVAGFLSRSGMDGHYRRARDDGTIAAIIIMGDVGGWSLLFARHDLLCPQGAALSLFHLA